MKFTITGSLGNISKPLATILIRAGHQVTIISSKKEKTSAITALGAVPAIGSVEDADFLTKAFAGADAVYTMIPPNFAVPDYRKYLASTGQQMATAIKASGVKRVVNLSSIGAHLPEGTGPIAGLYDVERLFNQLEGVAVKHLRAAFFYTNFLANIDMIKQMDILGANYGENNSLVMVHPDDIAKAAAEEIQQPFTGKTIRYVADDIRKAGEVASVLGSAIGKPDLKWVEFSDEQALAGMLQAGLPEPIAKMYTEMNTAVRSEKLWEDFLLHKPVLADIKLEQFATAFADQYLGII
jgi:uncharacterized protein YbjT (DUF2867 family)